MSKRKVKTKTYYSLLTLTGLVLYWIAVAANYPDWILVPAWIGVVWGVVGNITKNLTITKTENHTLYPKKLTYNDHRKVTVKREAKK